MKQTLHIKQLLSSDEHPGKNFAPIKVLVEDRGEGTMTDPPTPFEPIKVYDHITYDKYGGLVCRVMERIGDELTMVIVTNDPEDSLSPKFFDHVIWFESKTTAGEN